MKPRSFFAGQLAFIATPLAAIVCQFSTAATIQKADNANALNDTASWVGGVVPGAADIASWGPTVTSANSTSLGANLSWQGITLSNPGGAIAIGGANTLTLGTAGIDMVTATQDLSITSNLALASGGQTWNVATGRLLSITGGTITRSTGSTLLIDRITNSGTVTASPTLTNGVLPWVSVKSTGTASNNAAAGDNFATVSGGNIVAYTAATAVTTSYPANSAATNYDWSSAGAQALIGSSRSANTIRYTGTGVTQQTNSTQTETFNALMNAGSGTVNLGGGAQTMNIQSATGELILAAMTSGIVVNGPVINNGATAGAVTILGGSGQSVTLAGACNFTGGLNINSGTLVASRSNNSGNPTTSSVGNPQVARNLNVNSGGTLRITGADFMGSATTTPVATLVINQGGTVTNGGNNFNSFGPVIMNGGQLTTSGGAVAAYQSYNLMGSVTVGGSSASSISVSGAGNAFNGVHLNTNTLFTVADATSNSGSDLIVSAPLLNRNGSLGGAGGFTKDGAGTMTLTGTHPYTGPTSISGGTLQLGDGVTDGSITASSGITNNGNLAFNILGSQTYASPITGSGNLTLTGGGLLILSGANNLAGTTHLENGALRLNGTFGAISVANNPFNLLARSTGGSFTATSLAFAGDAAMSLILPGTVDAPAPVTVSGQLTAPPTSGQVVIDIDSPALGNGVHNLIGFGSFSGNISDFTANVITGLNSRQSASLVFNGSNLALQVVGDSPKWTGLDSGSWVFGNTGTFGNWKLITAGTATDFQSADLCLFDDTAAGATAIDINGGDVNPGAVTFNNSVKNYTLTSTTTDGISSGSLTKTGTGSLTISSDNQFAGGLTFEGGTLNLNSATAIGTGTFTIAPGSSKVLDNTSGAAITNSGPNPQSWQDDFTFTGSNDLDLGSGTVTLSGDGSERVIGINANTLTVGEIKSVGLGLTKQGAGTLVLTSTGAGGDASVLGGTLNIGAGTIQINRSGTDAAGSGDLTITGLAGTGSITNGAAVERWMFVNTSDDQTFTGTIANGGAGGLGFNKQGPAVLTLSGAISHTGQTTVEGGTLIIPVANSGTGTNPVVTSGTLVMAHPQAFGANATIRLAGNNVSTLNIATDGGDNPYGFVFATGVNSTIVSNRATEGEGINHTLTTIGANGIGGGTLTVTSGTNVTSGSGRITFTQFGLSAGAADQVTVLNPTTADVTVGAVSKVANATAQVLGLDGTTTDNHVTGLIANGTAVVSLRKTNESTWTISNPNNTYTGNTQIGAANGGGILRATATAALGTGTIVFDPSGGNPGPTSRLELSNNITLPNAITLHQRNNATPQILNTGGNNTLTGNINLNVGGGRGNIESEGGLLTLSGTISNATAVTRNLHLGGSADGMVSGPIVDNNLDPLGKVAVHKNGTGTWTLGGANTNTGETNVNAGTLAVSNPVLADSAAVRIAADAVLNLTHGATDTVDRLFIDGVEQYFGSWGGLSSSATYKTARITGSGILNVTNGVTPPSGYGTWAANLGLTAGVNDASITDAEFDGFDNGTEYLLGGHPLDGSNNPKIYSLLADSSADGDSTPELVLTIAVPQGTPAFSAGSPTSSATIEGYTITVRGSTDLAAFPITVTPVDPVTGGLPAAPVQGGITYEYRSFSLGGSNGTAGKGFLQVTVTHP